MNPPFRQSREAEALCALFLGLRDREPPLATWREIEDLTGRPRAALRGAIGTAVRRARIDHGVVVESDRNIGYRLRVNGEILASTQRVTWRVRRLMREGQEKRDCIDVSKISAEERGQLIAQQALGEIVKALTKPRSLANIVQLAHRKQNELGPDDLAQAARDAFVNRLRERGERDQSAVP